MIAPSHGKKGSVDSTVKMSSLAQDLHSSAPKKSTPLIHDDNTGLFLGWDDRSQAESFGFGQLNDVDADELSPIVYRGDGHAMTVAPTGAGKGVGGIIPNLLTWEGSMIVVDPKGENYEVTARRRKEMGQRVVILDPFHQIAANSDSLNPLDLFGLPSSYLDCDAEMVASQMAAGHLFSYDPYWNDMATPLTAGMIAHIWTTEQGKNRNLNKVRELFYHDDMDYHLAVLLDNKTGIKSKLARDEFVSYLSIPGDKTRPCVRSTATAYVKALGSDNVSKTLESSTFDLKDLMDGKPITIYIVIPPEKLESHRALLRLWVGTLLTAVIRRKHIPRRRTLFMIDEAAQLGTFPLLRQAITLHRGSGLQVWTFWQDLSQIKNLYPKDWETMVNNSAALQVFGVYNNLIARTWSDVLGVESEKLLSMPAEDAMLHLHGEGTRQGRKLSYLRDNLFSGQYDANQRFKLLAGPEEREQTAR